MVRSTPEAFDERSSGGSCVTSARWATSSGPELHSSAVQADGPLPATEDGLEDQPN